MSGILNVPGLWPVFDANGDPVSGATILFYEPGTTTPKAVYSDDTLATSLGTQLTTNAGGEPTTLAGAVARLWWAASGSVYDVQVIAGASTRTWSGVGIESGGGGGSGDVPLIESVAALRTTAWPSGRPDVIQLEYNHTAGDGGGFFRWDSASVLNDNNGGTRVKEDATSVGRWIRQINDGWVSASWFGLVTSADETTYTANTTANQRALNSGFNVRLPSGSFWCGQVTQSTAGQIVEGDWRTNWRHPAAVSGNLITINDTAVGAIWRNFKIDGNRANVAYFYNASEFLVFATDVEVSNISFINVQSIAIRYVGPTHRGKIKDNLIENCGDMGIFVNNAGVGDAIEGHVDNNSVKNFGLVANGGTTTGLGIGIRSAIGGWTCTNNKITSTVTAAWDRLGIEYWTNSNNGVISGNVIDGSVTNSMEFGLSCTGYGMAVGNNIVRGTSKYAIEIVDRCVSATGNIIRSPRGAGIAINLNPGHSDPGDVITVTGNTIEDITTTNVSFAGLIIAGEPGTTPIAITISGNTFHGTGKHMQIDNQVSGFTVSGNTFYNTGGSSSACALDGDNGAITGNNFFRVPTTGTNQTEAITIGANCTGLLVGQNRFVGNSKMTNGIVVEVGASNIYLSNNHFSGIISNSIFSSSTSPSVVVAGGFSNVGISLNAANRIYSFINSTDNQEQVANVAPGVGVYTVANLPIDVVAGQTAYASNGRKNGEGPGAGTGVMVFRDGSAWRACDTGATVAA